MNATRTSRPAILLGACLAMLPAPAAVAAAGWRLPDQPYRRPVTVPAVRKEPGAAGAEVAVLTMPTGGLTQPDGGDLRVTTATGTDLPSRVLMVGPGDCVRIAFEARPGVRDYHVYFGAAQPKGAAEALDIRRGVLLEMWQYPGGGIATLDQVRKVFQRAGTLVGRDFRDRIFLGHNPFSPINRTAAIFTGYARCEIPGVYTFSCSSQDASFLLVDEQVVVQNGGSHPPQRDIRKRGTIKLARGVHKITFYHVSTTADPIAVAAWRPPGGRRVEPIPASAFTKVHGAAPGPMEAFGKPACIDFLPAYAGESFVDNQYYQRYRFEALTSTRDRAYASRIRWTWNFGDGQAASQPRVDHVYLLPGPYTVTLKASTPAGDETRTNRIFVARPWDRVTENKLDLATDQAAIVATYNFAALSADAIAEALALLDRGRQKQAVPKAGAAFVDKPAASIRAIEKAMPIHVDALLAAGQADRAVGDLVRATRMTKAPAVCASLLTRAGKIALAGGKDEPAMELYDRCIQKYSALTTHASIREARIGIGDVWRHRGDYDKAAKAYDAAGIIHKDRAERAPIIKGDYARHVEDYIRKRQFEWALDFLDQWEEEFPADKLEGYWSWLRVQYLVGLGRQADAVREAETLVRVNGRSNYAPELLLLAHQLYTRLGKPKQARDALKRLAENYRESPLAAKAAAMLEGKAP